MSKTVYFCDECGTGFWTIQPQTGLICPNCLDGKLSEAEASTLENLTVPEPEGLLPFEVSTSLMQHNLDSFLQQIPNKPGDLTTSNLMDRLQKVYMPYWWVDVQVKAQWQAQIGFNYEVASRRELVTEGQTRSQEVHETRVRWEPRVGLLDRRYENIGASALESDREFKSQSGDFNLNAIQRNAADQVGSALIRLAQRPPKDAWAEAEIHLRQAAGMECQQACEAQHVRQFHWTAEYHDQHWTQLLLPIYITYYQDFNGKRHWVMINGQNGRISGEWTADLQKALLSSLLVAGGAGGLLLLGVLLLIFDVLTGIGFLLILAAMGVAAAAAYLFYRAWQFNQTQTPDYGGALT